MARHGLGRQEPQGGRGVGRLGWAAARWRWHDSISARCGVRRKRLVGDGGGRQQGVSGGGRVAGGVMVSPQLMGWLHFVR